MLFCRLTVWEDELENLIGRDGKYIIDTEDTIALKTSDSLYCLARLEHFSYQPITVQTYDVVKKYNKDLYFTVASSKDIIKMEQT